MEEIVDPILCIISLIRAIYYCNYIPIFFLCIKNKEPFVKFIDINTLLAFYIELTIQIVLTYFVISRGSLPCRSRFILTMIKFL